VHRRVELDPHALMVGVRVSMRRRCRKSAPAGFGIGSSSISASMTTSLSAWRSRPGILPRRARNPSGRSWRPRRGPPRRRHLHLAGGAQAVAAGVGQVDAGAQAASRMVWPSSIRWSGPAVRWSVHSS
jgi:hypothetical protein